MIEDDGLVLIEGRLYTPEVVQAAAAKKLHCNGRHPRAFARRYYENYGPASMHDLTTPTMAEMKRLGGAERVLRGPGRRQQETE